MENHVEVSEDRVLVFVCLVTEICNVELEMLF
jgi:hypothetical protein